MDLHEKIAREVAKAHGDEYDWFSDTAWFDEAADAILAILREGGHLKETDDAGSTGR